MLHIINKSHHLESCLHIAQANDLILLIEEGVTAAIKPIKSDVQIYALKPDVEARGLLDKVSASTKLINYEEFVDLTVQHYPIQTWS